MYKRRVITSTVFFFFFGRNAQVAWECTRRTSFCNSQLNACLRTHTNPPCVRTLPLPVTQGGGQEAIRAFILGDPAYPLLPHVMKEFTGGGATQQEQYFAIGLKLCKARMVIECAFGRLKARVGILRRAMDINLDELPNAIHACFVLHNYCEVHGESVLDDKVRAAIAIALCPALSAKHRTYTGVQHLWRKEGEASFGEVFWPISLILCHLEFDALFLFKSIAIRGMLRANNRASKIFASFFHMVFLVHRTPKLSSLFLWRSFCSPLQQCFTIR